MSNLNFYNNGLIQPVIDAEKPNSAINTHGANILIEQLYKFYGDVKVLEDLDLNIQAGEFVAIVGRSGCGKSTLLRLIAQLEKELGKSIQTGEFGADMKVALINDGPVTIVIDSKNKQ